MASEKTVNTVSVSCGGLVPPVFGAMFVYLKLTGVIDWSWWWILSPFWIPLALVFLVIFIAIAIAGGHALWIHYLDNKKQGV